MRSIARDGERVRERERDRERVLHEFTDLLGSLVDANFGHYLL